MPTIYCPNCEQVIPDDMTVCENCGFDLAGADEAEARIPKEVTIENDVLNVNKKVPEGQGKNLSEDEIQKLIAGNLVDLKISEEEKAAAAAKLAEKPITKEQEADIMNEVESAVVAEEKPVETIAGIKDEQLSDFFATVDDDAPQIEPETMAAPAEVAPEKRKSPVLYWTLTAAAAVVALGIGFLVCFVMFCMESVAFETEFSLRAARAVQSTYKNGETLLVYDSYVKYDAASTECVIFAVLQNGINNDDIRRYRVVVTNDESNVVKVYFELSDEAYKAMKESVDSETSIQASVLKNYSDTIKSSAADIAAGNKKWFRADSNYVNAELEAARDEAKSKETATATSGADTAEDIADLE